ncbi:alpha-1,2-fucosyltransferase [Candidatus Gottesmanbacteria bacterium]|nr:alpha-1,2-fucosyltransferase [Candidatus Gottesmanbacteria bacterium]
MIITELMGGLGNQMFQYALGKKLAIVCNTQLKIDLTEFKKQHLYPYRLHKFNIVEDFASKDDLRFILGWGYYVPRIFLRKVKIFFETMFPNIFYEKAFTFDKRILTVSDNSYLSGFWQSEKYFQEIRPVLLKEFTPKSPPSYKNRLVLKKIPKSHAVSIHFRRGDYMEHVKANIIHGVLSLDYYYKAVEFIKRKVKNPHFYIFSDSIDWVKKYFKPKGVFTYIDFNDAIDEYEDFRLMSACKYHIIANSTFSWWAAWLSQGKIVIGPEKWFRTPTLNSKDILPPTWVRL